MNTAAIPTPVSAQAKHQQRGGHEPRVPRANLDLWIRHDTLSAKAFALPTAQPGWGRGWSARILREPC
jgi:hypothetical protein